MKKLSLKYYKDIDLNVEKCFSGILVYFKYIISHVKMEQRFKYVALYNTWAYFLNYTSNT